MNFKSEAGSPMFWFICFACVYSSLADDNSTSEVIESNNQFTKDLYKSLSKQPGNVFFSPLSAHACLSMAYQAADGATKDAFASTLNLHPVVASEGYSSIMSNLNSGENITLVLANKVYVMSDYHLNPNFNNTLTEKFHAEAETVNFSDSAAAAEAVNVWVKEKTKEKIDKLFEPDAFTSDTRVVLANAIHFSANWKTGFPKYYTQPQPFYVDETKKVEVQMMKNYDGYWLKEDKELNAKVLRLPYNSNVFNMFVILPNEKSGLSVLEDKLLHYDLAKITQGLELYGVQLYLPKFKIETSIDLKDTLVELGLGIIFSNECNLSGMIIEPEPLFVSKALQKTYINVDEDGTEAAAATAIEIQTRAGRFFSKWTTFEANHPFIFMITKEESTNEQNILFYGAVRNPAGDS